MISPSEPPTRPRTRPKPSRQQDAVPNQPQNAIKLPTGEKSGLGLEKEINTFFRLRSPTVIARLRQAFPDMPDEPAVNKVIVARSGGRRESSYYSASQKRSLGDAFDPDDEKRKNQRRISHLGDLSQVEMYADV